MSVYVDDMAAEFGWMKMCHMIADTHVELMDMAAIVGVAHKWIQHRGDANEHFDICRSKRKLAVRFGAIEVTRRELASKVMARRLAVALRAAPGADMTDRFVIQITEHDGEQHVVEHEPTGEPVIHTSRTRAEKDAAFWRDGLGDEVQTVAVVKFKRGRS